MSEAHGDVTKHVRAYYMVFGALAVGTIVTVLAALYIHVSPVATVALALAIASVKGSCVAWIFMHLKWERGFNIWFVLVLCAFFFFVLLLIPTLTVNDYPPGVVHGTWG